MKYNFFVQERTIRIDERILNEERNKTISYKLKHIKSGIIIIINIDYDNNEGENLRLYKVKNKLKSFINSNDISINENHINGIYII